MKSKERAVKDEGIVGRYFVSENEEGMIFDQLPNGHYLVMDCGDPGDRVVHISQMRSWKFYHNEDQWDKACDERNERKEKMKREESGRASKKH